MQNDNGNPVRKYLKRGKERNKQIKKREEGNN